jgi:hypothetical protein
VPSVTLATTAPSICAEIVVPPVVRLRAYARAAATFPEARVTAARPLATICQAPLLSTFSS